jgi:hypothetical protein
MAIADVLKAAGLYEKAQQGKRITAELQKQCHPTDEGFGALVRNLSEEDFEAFVIYKAHIVLHACQYSNEDMAKYLPRSIKNSRTQYMKDYGRAK